MTFVPNLFFIGIGLAMLWRIAVSPAGRAPQPGDPGPWLIPTALAVLLVALGVIELIRKLAARRGSPSATPVAASVDDNAAETGVSTLDAPAWPARLVFVAALLGYVALFTRLGFTLATAGFLIVAILALSGLSARAAIQAVVIAAAASLGIGWLLAGVVGVPLPGALFVN